MVDKPANSDMHDSADDAGLAEARLAQREYLQKVAEFVERILGVPLENLRTEQDVIDVGRAQWTVAKNPEQITDDFAREVVEFHQTHGQAFYRAKDRLRGMRAVLGGSSRLNASTVSTCRQMALYADTILLPDPIMPWVERPRIEEQFPYVQFLLACYHMTRLAPFVSAETDMPPVFLFPSWEKSLEMHDEYTIDSIRESRVAFFSHYLGRPFSDQQEVIDYVVGDGAAHFRDAVNGSKLLFAPGADAPEPFPQAIERYRSEVQRWRTEEYRTNFVDGRPEEWLAFMCISERLDRQFHLRDNADCFSASPLISLEANWHYFRLCGEVQRGHLGSQSKLGEASTAAISALQDKRFRWLGNVPIADVVRLRQEGELAELRRRVSGCINELREADLGDIDRLAGEVGRELDAILKEHDARLEEIEAKYKGKHVSTATASWVSAIGALSPWLAPYIGVAAPVVLAAKYVGDKLAESREKKQAARSLVGVLAQAKEAG